MPPEAMTGATGTIQKPIYRDKLKSKSGEYFILEKGDFFLQYVY